MISNDIKLKTNLQELNKANPAPFSDQIIHNYYEYMEANGIYLLPESKKVKMNIPLNKVIGIAQMYGGKTWGQCLYGHWLKRLDRNLSELERNPDYYLLDQPKKDLYFIKIEDNFFISAGKHRTIIARFFSHFNPYFFKGCSPLKNVSVTEYFIDKEYSQMKNELAEVEKLYPELTFKMEHTTSLNDRSFLFIQKNDNCDDIQLFTRAQFGDVVDALRYPKLKNKLKVEFSDIDRRRNIYKMISYKSCLNSFLSSSS